MIKGATLVRLQLNAIQNASIYSTQKKSTNELAFGRAPNKEEKPEFEKDMKAGVKALGTENIALIVHGPSFPSRKSENTGVGSPYSNGALDLMKFIKPYQFNYIQFGPDGKLSEGNPSPYDSKTFAGNTLFINLKKLTGKEWGNILSTETLKKAKVKAETFENITKVKSECDFKHAFTMSEAALKEAWIGFKNKRTEGNPTIQKIDTKFQAYKEQNSDWLEKEAIYEALSKEHSKDPEVKKNNNNYKFWEDGVDKDLFGNINSDDTTLKDQAIKRKDELNEKDDVEFFKFSQFVLDEMKLKRRKQADPLGIKTMADKKVDFSESDVWANQEAFLKDWRLGVPPDYFSKTGQAWNFEVLNPDKMFERNEKGEIQKDENGKVKLGPAGKFLFSTFDKMFKDNPGGTRIDHIPGVIDPFVYPDGKLPLDKDSGRLYSSPDNPKLAKWAKVDADDIDTAKDPYGPDRIKEDTFTNSPEKLNSYAELLENIIIPAAEKNGVAKSNIVCEDLGVITRPITPVLNKLNVSGIRVTEFEDPNNPEDANRASNIPTDCWAALGTHDNDSLINWTEEIFKNPENKKSHIKTLTEDLKPDNPQEFEKKLGSDPKEFMKAKVAALFASPAKNIQIFWADLLGIKERYNLPGSPPEDNWKLRVPNQFQDLFYTNLENNQGINMPEVMKMALESKHDKKLMPLINNLDKWSKILKEPDKNEK